MFISEFFTAIDLFTNFTNWSIMVDSQSLKYCIVAKMLYNLLRFSKTLLTRYSLPNHNISGELKSSNSFGYFRHYGPVILLHFITTSETGLYIWQRGHLKNITYRSAENSRTDCQPLWARITFWFTFETRGVN